MPQFTHMRLFHLQRQIHTHTIVRAPEMKKYLYSQAHAKFHEEIHYELYTSFIISKIMWAGDVLTTAVHL